MVAIFVSAQVVSVSILVMAYLHPFLPLFRHITSAPGVNDTDADRGRIPAWKNALARHILPTAIQIAQEKAADFSLSASLTMLEKEDEVEELEDELHAHDCLVGGGAAEDAVGQELRVELEEEEDELGYLGVSLSTQVAQREQVLEDRILFLALEQLAHTYSFDNIIRAPFVAVVVADFTPWYSHSVDVFKTLAGGWDNEGFIAMCDALSLLPQVIVTDNKNWDRRMAIFLLHYRWTHPESYTFMETALGIERSRLCKVCNTTLDLLIEHYHVTVACIDVLAILPQINDWNDALLEDFGGPGGNFGSAGSAPIGQPYVVGIVDGSAKETGTPGSGTMIECH